MDDQPAVSKVLKRFLEKSNYEVEAVPDGETAVESFTIANEKGHPFDLVILDIIIPDGMGGEDTLKELLKIDPDIKAIVTSGYAENDVLLNFKNYGFHESIQKPFNLPKIYEKVTTTLQMKNKNEI